MRTVSEVTQQEATMRVKLVGKEPFDVSAVRLSILYGQMSRNEMDNAVVYSKLRDHLSVEWNHLDLSVETVYVILEEATKVIQELKNSHTALEDSPS